ncbi:gap junction delta-4 protein-like [Pygocentrus nattereri]|uniref:gap junction delta-4 protein-like n=1 Tax=Pygocentrus nattereri TaxID=42514 RepID=UPI001891B9C6|nr:gap junction delta-4 protein-like [Pygocentrus nattereri]
MEKVNAVEVLYISLNQTIPFIGKLWLAAFILLRVFVLLFAGFPLFWDEGDRFVCNTIHPGCASVCFDVFAPLSLCRLGFLHLMFVCLPTILYVTHHTHRVLTALTCRYFTQEPTLPLKLQKPNVGGTKLSTGEGFAGRFTGQYLLHLILRVFLELAFGVGHYILFGFSVRRDFLCLQPPCSPAVECFTSRPTEKAFLLQWMMGNIVLSVILSIAEMWLVLRGSIQHRKRKAEEENEGKMKSNEGQKRDFFSKENNEKVPSSPSSTPFPFKKRKPSDDPILTPSLTPKSSLSPWSEAGRAHTPSCSHTLTPEEASEQEGSEVVLCSAERLRQWKGRYAKNVGVKAPLASNSAKAAPWSPAPKHVWQARQYTPVPTMTEHTSDSSESQDRKAWV